VKREIDPDAPQKIRENCGALQDTPANRAFVQDCVELAEYNLKHGIGDCHGVPQIIEKSGPDFCGQWKEKIPENMKEFTGEDLQYLNLCRANGTAIRRDDGSWLLPSKP
jgi:hypothetical protein